MVCLRQCAWARAVPVRWTDEERALSGGVLVPIRNSFARPSSLKHARFRQNSFWLFIRLKIYSFGHIF